MPFLATASSVGRLLFFGRAVDHPRIDARLHGFQNVAPGQVDRRRPLEVEVDDLRLAGGDHRANHQRHVAAGQIVGFERLGRDALAVVQAGLHRHDLAARDHRRVHLAKRHPQQVEDADPRAGRDRLNPQPEVAGEDREQRQPNDHHDHQRDQHHRAAAEEPIGEENAGEHRLHGIHLNSLRSTSASGETTLSASQPCAYNCSSRLNWRIQARPTSATRS